MKEEKLRDSGATPWELIHSIEEVFNVKFSLDVCASADNAKATTYYNLEDDGLKQSWKVKQGYAKQRLAWVNPPYSCVSPWIEHAANFSHWMMLLKNDPSTKWFKTLVSIPGVRIFFLTPRVQHVAPPGVKYSTNNFSSILAYCEGVERNTYEDKFGYFDWKARKIIA